MKKHGKPEWNILKGQILIKIIFLSLMKKFAIQANNYKSSDHNNLSIYEYYYNDELLLIV